MNIEMPYTIETPEKKISDFILCLTGLRTKEEDDGKVIRLCLGIKDRIEVGFYKDRHPDKKWEDIKYSMYTRMLQAIAEMMQGPDQFSAWIAVQHALDITEKN
jgi:hypothetical protein